MWNRTVIMAIGLGILGGLVGTLLMDAVMITTFVSVGEPADLFFSAVGEKLGGGAIIGVGLHNLIGMTGGLIFSVAVLNLDALTIHTMKKGVVLGLAAGAITIPAGCVPLAFWLGQPVLEVVAFSLMPHLVWGTTLGAIFAYGLLSMRARA